jgi:branched-chain amino acid transport system permease protein
MNKKLVKYIIMIAIVLAIFGVIQILSVTELLNGYYISIIIYICIYIIMALGLNLVLGYTGQLSLGHAGFMSIGAYAAATLTMKFQMPFIVAIVVSGIVAGIFGFLIGFPVLRLKGDYLAITTLAFGEIIRVVINNIDYLNGPRGIVGIPNNTDFPWAYFIMIISLIVIYNVIHSSHGRAMISVREDEIAAESMGVNTFKYKILAFVIAAFFAGVAGALYAHVNTVIKPTDFGFLKSVDFVIYVVAGGMGSLTGSILGVIILVLLPEVLRPLQDIRMVMYPVLLIVLMLFRPQGIMGMKELSFKVFKKKKRGDENAAS